MPQPGDRCPGFTVKPMRCWTMSYDSVMQAHHCDERPTYTGCYFSLIGDPASGFATQGLWATPLASSHRAIPVRPEAKSMRYALPHRWCPQVLQVRTGFLHGWTHSAGSTA
jgi:hypothetical protein